MPNTICQSECALNPELVRSFCIHIHTRTRTIYQPEFALKNKNHTRTQTKGWDLSERAALEHRKVLSTASRANEETTRKDDMERERQSRFLESLHNGDVVENLDLRSEEQFPSLPMSRMKGAVMPTPIATTNQDVQGHGVASALDTLEQPHIVQDGEEEGAGYSRVHPNCQDQANCSRARRCHTTYSPA